MAFPSFFGHKGEKALDFLDDLEMAFLVTGRDDEATKVRAFSLVLKGDARVWYQALPEATRGNGRISRLHSCMSTKIQNLLKIFGDNS